jgi:hypothetical protein
VAEFNDVSKWLDEIADMAQRLESRAISRAGDKEMPGGEAMVNLASVGSVAIWARRYELAEEAHEADWNNPAPDTSFEDPDELWPPIQILWYWSESFRAEVGMDYDDPAWRPSLISEAKFLRNRDVADHIWSQPGWDDYAKDVQRAHTKLEAILIEGERVAFRGVSCMYEDCKGARLIRKTVPAADKAGNKVWRLTDWHCPKCKRSWSEDEYTRNIYSAILRSKITEFEDDDSVWCTVDLAATRVGRPNGTLRSWLSRGELGAICALDNGRTFVRYDDVVARDDLAKKRHEKRKAAIAAKRLTAV